LHLTEETAREEHRPSTCRIGLKPGSRLHWRRTKGERLISAWRRAVSVDVLHDLPMLHVDGVLFEKVFMESMVAAYGLRADPKSAPLF